MFAEDLHQLVIFEDLNVSQLALLTPFLNEAHYSQGDLIFEQGADARFLYIVACGEVVVRHKPYDGPAIVVAHVKRGGVFGWSAVLGHCTYTSTAECATTLEVYRVSGADLHGLCEQHPDTGVLLLEHLAAATSERLGNTHRHLLSLLTRGINEEKECEEGSRDNGHY